MTTLRARAENLYKDWVKRGVMTESYLCENELERVLLEVRNEVLEEAQTSLGKGLMCGACVSASERIESLKSPGETP